MVRRASLPSGLRPRELSDTVCPIGLLTGPTLLSLPVLRTKRDKLRCMMTAFVPESHCFFFRQEDAHSLQACLPRLPRGRLAVRTLGGSCCRPPKILGGR